LAAAIIARISNSDCCRLSSDWAGGDGEVVEDGVSPTGSSRGGGGGTAEEGAGAAESAEPWE